jgi:HAD superfamily hydrolase (TIGR01459 family)
VRRAREIGGLGEIADRYDAFLFDQYGVLHDGVRPYAGTAEVLARLAPRSLIITNSGKRSAANQERLARLGIARVLYHDLLSSGEVAWTGLRDGSFGRPFVRGGRAYIVGRAGDSYGFDGLDLVSVEAPAHADFILILGSDAPATSLDRYGGLLQPAAAIGLPALCCNPDRLMLTGSGSVPAPGAIAEIYASLGGPVRWIGKPRAEIYRAALALAGNPPPSRVLALGDSVEHDIVGAAALGIATALVRTGVSNAIGLVEIAARSAVAGCEPDWILPELKW